MWEPVADPAAFFTRDPLEVAHDLVGSRLTVDDVAVRLTEVEAYCGEIDPGSHAFRGETRRNRAMFGPPGNWYVYVSYGIHRCINMVCWPDGKAGGVLLRAGEVVDGAETVRQRRPGVKRRDWARGPGRLAQALAVGLDDYGMPVASGRFSLSLGERPTIATSTRVGVNGPGGTMAYPWRFYAADDPYVSDLRSGSLPRQR